MTLGAGDDSDASAGVGEPEPAWPDVPRPETLLPDAVVDERYRVIRRLAAGGMGEVYLAEHVQLGKPVALKVMLPELSCNPALTARFKREAIAASRIGQQNIVEVLDFGQTKEGQVYFVMEYLAGETLGRAMRGGPMGTRWPSR